MRFETSHLQGYTSLLSREREMFTVVFVVRRRDSVSVVVITGHHLLRGISSKRSKYHIIAIAVFQFHLVTMILYMPFW
jgi:hypothetical protein